MSRVRRFVLSFSYVSVIRDFNLNYQRRSCILFIQASKVSFPPVTSSGGKYHVPAAKEKQTLSVRTFQIYSKQKEYYSQIYKNVFPQALQICRLKRLPQLLPIIVKEYFWSNDNDHNKENKNENNNKNNHNYKIHKRDWLP